MNCKKILINLVFVYIGMHLVVSEFIAPHDDEIKHQWNVFKSTHSNDDIKKLFIII